MLIILLNLSKELSVAATLLIRLCTLWFGVGIGFVALFVYRKRFFSAPADPTRVQDLSGVNLE